jgi:predicted nucleic acid-binding protein
MTPPVVIDTGVFVSGIYWRAEPHLCLKAWLRGAFVLAVTEAVFEEYRDAAWRVQAKTGLDIDPAPWLESVRNLALWVEPLPLGKPTCRDVKDDKLIEAALGAGARRLVARDADLCVLEKPFGVEILTPRAFLSKLPRQVRRLR